MSDKIVLKETPYPYPGWWYMNVHYIAEPSYTGPYKTEEDAGIAYHLYMLEYLDALEEKIEGNFLIH